MDVVIPRRTRRTHSEAFKQSVISACREPGVSVAGVALANGLNANQVRKRPTIGVLQVIQRFGLISSVNSPSSHARAMAASRRVSSW